MALGPAALRALTQLVPWILEEPNTDAVAVLDMSMQHAGRWLFATRQVFLELEPHYLASFSAGMMAPRVAKAAVGLAPGMHRRRGRLGWAGRLTVHPVRLPPQACAPCLPSTAVTSRFLWMPTEPCPTWCWKPFADSCPKASTGACIRSHATPRKVRRPGSPTY